MQEGKLGAGEQIMARRRTRRLVPDGSQLSTRGSAAAGTYPGAAGGARGRTEGSGADAQNPMGRRAETLRPRSRPNTSVSPGSTVAGNGAASLSPKSHSSSEESFYPARSTASELPSPSPALSSAFSAQSRAGSDEVLAPGVPPSPFAQPGLVEQEKELPPAVQDRIRSYYK